MASNIIYWTNTNNIQLPDDMAVDPNTVLKVAIKSDPDNIAATQFVQYCHQNDKTLYITGIHGMELKHQIEKAISREVGRKRYNLHYNNMRYDDQNGYKLFYDDLIAAGADFDSEITPQVDAAIQSVTGLMQFLPTTMDLKAFSNIARLRKAIPYDVETNDLLGLITMHDYGINSIVTSDSRIAKVNNINIIQVLSGRQVTQRRSDIIPFSQGCIYIK